MNELARIAGYLFFGVVAVFLLIVFLSHVLPGAF